VLGSVLAYQLGIGAMVGAMDLANTWLNAQPRLVDLALVLAPLLGLLVAVVPLLRIDIREALEGGREASVSIRLRLLNLVVGIVALVVATLLVWHIVAESMLHAGS
jgi:hypothetical protein